MLWQCSAAEGAAQAQSCVLVAESSKQHGTCCDITDSALPSFRAGCTMCALPCNTDDLSIACMLASRLSVYMDISQGYVKSTSARSVELSEH